MKRQRGGFVMGLIVGLLVGLAMALAVALYVTKVPVPFVNKVPQRTAEQDAAEVERNKNWDPNGPLATRPGRPASAALPALVPVPAPPSASALPAVPARPPTATASAPRDPAAILAGQPPATKPVATPAADPFVYFVQAGAFARADEAEQQRARLAIMGYEAKVTEREQSGKTVFRVRVGPFDRKEGADGAKEKLAGAGVDAALVRVQK